MRLRGPDTLMHYLTCSGLTVLDIDKNDLPKLKFFCWIHNEILGQTQTLTLIRDAAELNNPLLTAKK